MDKQSISNQLQEGGKKNFDRLRRIEARCSDDATGYRNYSSSSSSQRHLPEKKEQSSSSSSMEVNSTNKRRKLRNNNDSNKQSSSSSSMGSRNRSSSSSSQRDKKDQSSSSSSMGTRNRSSSSSSQRRLPEKKEQSSTGSSSSIGVNSTNRRKRRHNNDSDDIDGSSSLPNGKGSRKASSGTKSSSSYSSSAASPRSAKATVSKPVKKKVKKNKLNSLDPIMFVPLKKKNIFKFHRSTGSTVAFNVESLADYLLKSGDFCDPETRIPFTDEELEEIDSLITKSGNEAKRGSVLAAKRNPQHYIDAKFHRDALEGLERCAGDVIAKILNMVEDPEQGMEIIQMRLFTSELPEFADYWRQLHDADSAYALQCMEHWKSFINGPPNKPNDDDFGLIEFIKMFLDGITNVGNVGGVLGPLAVHAHEQNEDY